MGPGQPAAAMVDEKKDEASEVVLALESGWAFLPSEAWRVDVCGLWSLSGSDQGKCFHFYRLIGQALMIVDGWVYTDDSWQVSTFVDYTPTSS